jgi:di/tricarboxylate transporter
LSLEQAIVYIIIGATLVMLAFEFWRLGLPLELLITVVTVPILLMLWPL